MAPVIAYTMPAIQLVCTLVMNDTSKGLPGNNSTTQIPSAILPEGYIAHPAIGAAYKVYNDSVTWKVARENCLEEGARLAYTHSFREFEELMYQAPLMNAIHVGIHRMYDDTEWVSATNGSTLLTPPWAPGYPNGVYDCVLAGYSPRGLRNGACASKANYVCEIPIQQNYIAEENREDKIAVN